MKIILLSGGSGSRLWPMSNESRSKQFLRILHNESNQSISMLQRIWTQLEAVELQNRAYICAPKSQMEMIIHQIGYVPIIEEPTRRDTFPAIALSTLYLLDKEGCTDDESIVVMPVDHLVENRYFHQVVRLGNILNESEADLALMGVKPTVPTNKFGYIKVDSSQVEKVYWRQVSSFVEKPDTEIAKQLISEGALWNCGVFCFKAGFLKSILQSQSLPTTYEDLLSEFSIIQKQSFDYAVVEKTKSIVVIPYDGTWKDLGTWSALSEEIEQEVVGIGNILDCENTHIVNELGIPVVGIGLSDVVVVATPDGILISDKEKSSNLKKAIGAYQGRPMYEERRWGKYRVLNYEKLSDGTEVLTRTIELIKGNNLSYQKHYKRSEIWTIVEGTGEVAIDERIFPVSAGDVIRIYAEQWHAIRAIEMLKFIEVQRGSELIEEDIIRKYQTWSEIEIACGQGRTLSPVIV